MRNETQLSRRAALGLAIVPLLQTTGGGGPTSDDEQLLRLHRELQEALAALEKEGDHDIAISILDRMEAICTEIANIPANGVKGLCVKARATAWAIEDDFGMLDPATEPTTSGRVTASLVRDLLRMGSVRA